MASHWDEVRKAISELRSLLLGDDIDAGLSHLSNLVDEADKRNIGGNVTEPEATTTETEATEPRVTADILEKAGACSGYVSKFKKLFPNGTVITEELAAKHCQDFDWEWAAENLLNTKGYEEFLKESEASYGKYDDALNKLHEQRQANNLSYDAQEQKRDALRDQREKTLAEEFARLACAGYYAPKEGEAW